MRNAWQVHQAVLSALFLREAVGRLSAGRAAWLWILLEPVAHLAFLMTVFGFVLHRVVSGVDGAMFIATGLLGFFLARNTATRSMSAIDANTSLFTYRQVMPVDTVLVRAALEGVIGVITGLIVLAGASLFGYSVVPHDPLMAGAAVVGLWLSGAGLGLLLSVLSELVPEIGRMVKLMFTPLYFVSGIMYPALAIPKPYRDWLMFNPFVHGMELLRSGFFPQFHAAHEASLSYLYGFALVAIFFGLAMHVRFAERLIEQ